jgi:hypothetical protein
MKIHLVLAVISCAFVSFLIWKAGKKLWKEQAHFSSLIASLLPFLFMLSAFAMATKAAFGQDASSIPDTIQCTYGESPTSSGLTCDASWDAPAFSISLNAAQGYALWLPMKIGDRWSVIAGPAAGFNSQVPFGSVFLSASAPMGTTVTIWVGAAAGHTDYGPKAELRSFFNYADVGQRLGNMMKINLAILQFQGDQWNLLPSLTLSPEFISAGRLIMSVTYDTNAAKPLFVIGVSLDL